MENAFQTVQNLIQGTTGSEILTKKLNEILNQVSNNEVKISNESIKATSSSSSSSASSQNIKKKPPSNNVPEYKPTPIRELMRINSSSNLENEDRASLDDESQMKKRKLSGLNSEDVQKVSSTSTLTSSIKKSKTDEQLNNYDNSKQEQMSESEIIKLQMEEKRAAVMKRMKDPGYIAALSSPAYNSISNSASSSSLKIDKLSLQQQLMKRYEILNRFRQLVRKCIF